MEVNAKCVICCRVRYIETSAATGYNVNDCMMELVDAVLQRMETAVDETRLTLGKKEQEDSNQPVPCIC